MTRPRRRDERPMGMFIKDEIEHHNGVCWGDAPIPPRFHRCYVQTSGWIGLEQVQRCACGAIRNPRFGGGWLEKNARRKSERDELRRKWRGQE